jgi:hypothetical protein
MAPIFHTLGHTFTPLYHITVFKYEVIDIILPNPQ